MINSTKLGRWASKCASISTSNKNRILFLLISLLTFNAATALAEGKWVETNIADIQSGDEVVITVSISKEGGTTTYAISNEGGDDKRPNAVIVDVEDYRLVDDTQVDNLKWKINKSDNAFTFLHPTKEENGLYCRQVSGSGSTTREEFVQLDGVTTNHTGVQYELQVGSYTSGPLTNPQKYYTTSFTFNIDKSTCYDAKTQTFICLLNAPEYWWRCVNATIYSRCMSNQTLKFYKYVGPYTREVQPNNFGTICLPKGSSTFTGATFYEIAGKEVENGNVKGITLASVDKLEAGMPYIFQVNNDATQIIVTYDEGEKATEAGQKNGLYGTFTNGTPVESGNYIIHEGTEIAECGTGCYVNSNRAYIKMDEVPESYTKMPGRRYIGMGVQGENEATGLDNTTASEEQIIKVIENGQLIIIRNGEKYNVQGQKL